MSKVYYHLISETADGYRNFVKVQTPDEITGMVFVEFYSTYNDERTVKSQLFMTGEQFHEFAQFVHMTDQFY